MLIDALTHSFLILALFLLFLTVCGAKAISLPNSLLTAGMWASAFLIMLK